MFLNPDAAQTTDMGQLFNHRKLSGVEVDYRFAATIVDDDTRRPHSLSAANVVACNVAPSTSSANYLTPVPTVSAMCAVRPLADAGTDTDADTDAGTDGEPDTDDDGLIGILLDPPLDPPEFDVLAADGTPRTPDWFTGDPSVVWFFRDTGAT